MKEDEIKEIFLAEALEANEELNRLFTQLEKDHGNIKAIDAIFRITHTLKANAAGMGYENIAEMSHTLEDVFSEIRSNKLQVEEGVFADLFKANDALGALINALKDTQSAPVKYKGIKTKLEVILRKAKFGLDSFPPPIQVKSKTRNEVKIENPKQGKLPPSKAKTELAAQPTGVNTLVATADAEKEPTNEEFTPKVAFSDLVQIPIRKLDHLMNLVGELIIERDRVITLAGGKSSTFTRLQRITSELQYSVMDARLVQINVLFSKFHRIVRDTASLEHKKVNLVLEGTDIEIDRSVLQIMSESLVHVVRNAISHGIENPEQRVKQGKQEYGTVSISAKNDKDTIEISVKDDGKGIDSNVIVKKAIEKGLVSAEMAQIMSESDIIQLIFEPGFSSVEVVTEVSGRGVGMDVVKRSIDSIGGRVEVHTTVGKGSEFCLTLPSSMALKSALLFELGDTTYAIPLTYTNAVIQLLPKEVHRVGKGLMATHLQKNIPIVFLNDLFSVTDIALSIANGGLQNGLNKAQEGEKLYVIVVSYGYKEIGFVVDKPLQQKEIVEKPLKAPLDNAPMFSGATILGNGHVCLVLDVPYMVNKLVKTTRKQP